MKAIARLALSAAPVSAVAIGALWHAEAREEKIKFPKDCASGLHYATVRRGDIREEIYTSPTAIDAAKAGQRFPSGTVISLVDFRSDKLYRTVVMEKRTGWGTGSSTDISTGEWSFQSNNPDGSIKGDGQPEHRMSCHHSQSSVVDRMKSTS